MNIETLTPEVLREVLSLVEKKQSLDAEIAKIDTRIRQISGGIETGKSATPKKTPQKRAPKIKRGKLKESILRLLEEAGQQGVGVQEIATKLAAKPQSVHAWFQTTGRKVPGISKAGRGRYALAPVSQS